MIKPVIGSIVKIAAYNLREGMKMIHDGETVTILDVEIEITEENAVSFVYLDQAGKDWAGYCKIAEPKRIEYTAGINLIDIID